MIATVLLVIGSFLLLGLFFGAGYWVGAHVHKPRQAVQASSRQDAAEIDHLKAEIRRLQGNQRADVASACADYSVSVHTSDESAARAQAERNERPVEVRHPFRCEQWVAPYVAHKLPACDEFIRVECRDISSSGISFLMSHHPEHELIIVRLGHVSAAKHVVARIRRVVPSGEQYAIDCQFLERLTALAALAV